MKKKSLLIISGTILLILIGGSFLFLKRPKQTNEFIPTMPEGTKKIAMIVAFRDFRDEEYFIPKKIFEENGYEVITVSTNEGVAIGAGGGEAQVDLTIDNLNVDEYEAIVFVGGPGAFKNIDNPEFHRVAQEGVEKGKIVAAICIAPAILAQAGILEGKNATVWSSALDKTGVKILQENGANYLELPVVQDGKIITANGPQSAEEFAKKIVEAL